jgi:nucleotide-binding universal stress UspA family protein
VDKARQRIVVGIDGSAGARVALAWALTEAASRRADVEVVTAFPVDFYWTDAYLLDSRRIDAIRSDTEARARATVDEVRRDPTVAALPGAADIDVKVLVVAGPPAVHLVERSDDAALLVVGSRGRGALQSTVAGSVALHCSAHATCPVVVVHPMTAPAGEPARVVVGLDDSEHGRAALAAAVAQAAPQGARVDAVLAYEPLDYWSDLYEGMAPSPGETLEQALARGKAIVTDVLAPASVESDRVRVLAAEGRPGQVLIHQAEGARLLVVGSRSRNQLQGVLLGSVALHCVMHAPCPVLVVHPRPNRSVEPAARDAVAAAAAAG